jgi:CheY-like chemotaxis protein
MSVSGDPVPCPAPARILLVEDDAELRALVAATLGNAGFEVIEAKDGENFIDRLAEALAVDRAARGFDLILSDIQMPIFSALDVLVGARRLIGKTPVILMTAFGDAPTEEQALRRGAELVLNKPIRMAALCETVVRLLARTRPGPPGPPAAL